MVLDVGTSRRFTRRRLEQERFMTPALKDALKSLEAAPVEIWTDSERGQQYVELTRMGYAYYRRKNATLGVFKISGVGKAKLAKNQAH